MNAEARQIKFAAIRARIASGESRAAAAMREGVSEQTLANWEKRAAEGRGFADAPRSGRPQQCTLTEADAQALAEHALQSNRARGKISMTMAARYCAKNGLVSQPVADAILKPRASKHLLPSAVVAAMREVSAPAVVRRYRDPKAGAAVQPALGWLRMREDGKRPHLPFERVVVDDASVNVGVAVPWTRDKKLAPFGWRVSRFQLLMIIDSATDFIIGWGYVMRDNDAYRAADVVRVLQCVFTDFGAMPREIVLEGGCWQSEKTKRFLSLAGTQAIDAKGRPWQKLVESFFTRKWTALSLHLPPKGQIGRFRGEMRTETQQWLDCRDGKCDPRDHFLTADEFFTAMDKSVAFMNSEPIESRTYSRTWTPEVEFDARDLTQALPSPAGLWREALPDEFVGVMRRDLTARHSCESPFGFKHQYSFTFGAAHKYEGAKVRVQFDPYNIGGGAVFSLASDWQGEPAGKLLDESGKCTSPAPDLRAIHGFHDARASVRNVKGESRAMIATTIHTYDTRSKEPKRNTLAYGTSPRRTDYAQGKAAHVEEAEDAVTAIRAANRADLASTNWAAKEAAAALADA